MVAWGQVEFIEIGSLFAGCHVWFIFLPMADIAIHPLACQEMYLFGVICQTVDVYPGWRNTFLNCCFHTPLPAACIAGPITIGASGTSTVRHSSSDSGLGCKPNSPHTFCDGCVCSRSGTTFWWHYQLCVNTCSCIYYADGNTPEWAPLCLFLYSSTFFLMVKLLK